MTRVSSLGQQQVMLNSILNNQSQLFKNQKQVASGKVGENYKEFTGEVNTLLGSKNVLDRTVSYMGSATHVKRNLDVNNLQLESIMGRTEDIRHALLESVAQDKTFVLMDTVEEAFSSIIASLNTDIGGVHIFSGGRTDVPPIVGDNIGDLVAATSAADMFQNDGRKAIAKIGANTNMEYSLLADEVAEDVFAAIKALADFDALTPISGDLTPAQSTFIESQLAVFDSAIEDLRVVMSSNGMRFGRADELLTEHEENDSFMLSFISDIEDVNMAEAITRVNNDSKALEISYKLTSELSRLSLLNFI
ncbi:MAG: flagellin [Emcibacteraceae bacterium]|nr:flagellin [Emcibacteraceae bacterium]